MSDLSPLAGLMQLARLDLSGCSSISDLQVLTGLRGLNVLFLGRDFNKELIPNDIEARNIVY